jgi:hypothetical protein
VVAGGGQSLDDSLFGGGCGGIATLDTFVVEYGNGNRVAAPLRLRGARDMLHDMDTSLDLTRSFDAYEDHLMNIAVPLIYGTF